MPTIVVTNTVASGRDIPTGIVSILLTLAWSLLVFRRVYGVNKVCIQCKQNEHALLASVLLTSCFIVLVNLQERNLVH